LPCLARNVEVLVDIVLKFCYNAKKFIAMKKIILSLSGLGLDLNSIDPTYFLVACAIGVFVIFYLVIKNTPHDPDVTSSSDSESDPGPKSSEGNEDANSRSVDQYVHAAHQESIGQLTDCIQSLEALLVSGIQIDQLNEIEKIIEEAEKRFTFTLHSKTSNTPPEYRVQYVKLEKRLKFIANNVARVRVSLSRPVLVPFPKG
jgi:hypothetical protein